MSRVRLTFLRSCAIVIVHVIIIVITVKAIPESRAKCVCAAAAPVLYCTRLLYRGMGSCPIFRDGSAAQWLLHSRFCCGGVHGTVLCAVWPRARAAVCAALRCGTARTRAAPCPAPYTARHHFSPVLLLHCTATSYRAKFRRFKGA